MKFGIVGLGRMGSNIARHAIEKQYSVVGYDHDNEPKMELAQVGLEPASSVEELVAKLSPPRIILLYVPHGAVTENVCQELRLSLNKGDTVIDGGNSKWTDSQRRYSFFAEQGVQFLDAGTSGGVNGARNGACFMVGGDKNAYDMVFPLLRDLAIDNQGVIYTGPAGSGHFVKLVHNAIEFGMVQAIAEGVELLNRSEYDLDLPNLFDNWMHGSVIRSWLVQLMGKALSEHQDLDELSTYVEDTGEVKWILDWALEQDIPTPAVSIAQTMLMQYRDLASPTAKSVSLLRNQYGGHPIHRASERSDQQARNKRIRKDQSAA